MPTRFSSPVILNLAAFLIGTHTHGPGRRAVAWVQGCPFHCSGCIAKDWQPQILANQTRIDELAHHILASPVTGLTFSGGEPMLQAEALTNLVEAVRQQRPTLDVICFTGYTWSELLARSTLGETGIERLLSQVDVLIDGPYIKAQNNGRGLRGSTNQVIHRLTERGRAMKYDFENAPRQVEFHIGNENYLLAGIPPAQVLTTLENL